MPSVQRSFESNKVTVFYPMGEARQELESAEYELVRSLPDKKIICIKFIRAVYKLSLTEAKNIVETIHDQSSN